MIATLLVVTFVPESQHVAAILVEMSETDEIQVYNQYNRI